MQSFSLYFVFALLVGGGLLWAAQAFDKQEVTEFYGFAQTEETEINFNYPIEVQEILVKSGQTVKRGDLLMRVKRARSKERLADQDFRIDELRAEERISLQRIDAKLTELDQEFSADKAAIQQRKASLESEQSYRQQVLEALSPQDQAAVEYAPLDAKIKALDNDLNQLTQAYRANRKALQQERALITKPYTSARKRLAAERDFDASRLEVSYDITAPADGVIGSVNAKLAEHKSSFAPLLIFYEPHPSEVRAFIHEERVLEASLGDSVYVASITADKAVLAGVISGLGSRVVSVPSRLRRMPDVATYGREVIVSIPKKNPFLQNEKVRVAFKLEDL